MKPYGRFKKVKFPGKTDFHIQGLARRQGWVNWWEVEFDTSVRRTTIKQSIKKDIKNDINDNSSNSN